MLTSIRLYREYRRQGLKHAWRYAGMNRVAMRAAKYSAAAVLMIYAAVLASRQAEAIQAAADNRVAAKLAGQAGEIQELRSIVAACLGDREGALFIGGELHLCRAVPTGIHQ